MTSPLDVRGAIARLRTVAVVALAVLTGCAGSGAPRATPGGPRFSVIETLPADGEVTADELNELFAIIDDDGAAAQRTFEIVEGDDVGTRLVISAAPTDEHGATCAVTVGEQRIEYLARTGDGGVTMPSVHDLDEKVVTRFDPPLLLAPRELTPGTPVDAESKMTVLDAATLSKRRESGTATRTITYLDDQRIRTPLGTFVARRVVLEFTADLRMADVERRDTFWVVPERGVVARSHEERMKVLGLLGSSNTATMVLVD